MKFYPFSDVELDAIRFFGMSGYRYATESKEALGFFSDRRADWVYLNREADDQLQVIVDLRGRPRPDAEDLGMRASSNFKQLPLGSTSRGKANHQGRQFRLKSPSHLPHFFAQLNGSVP